MRKLLAIMLVLCIVMGTMSGCGARDDSSEEMEFEQLKWPTYDNAKQIPVPKSSMADVQNKNDVRFSFYLANTTFEDFTDYVAACKEKGFTVDPVEQDRRYYAFNNARYELTVEYHEGDIMYVSVVEERFDVEIKLLHVNKTSADMYDLRIEIDGDWEDASGCGDEAVSFDSYLREGKHTLIVENAEDNDINGRIDFEIVEDGEYLEFEINCLSNRIEISRINGTISENSKNAQETDIAYPVDPDDYLSQSVPGSDNSSQSAESVNKNESAQKGSKASNDEISLTQAKNIFEDVFSEYDKLVEDFSDLLDYCNQTNFTSEDQIHECEEQWADLANTANELAYKLEANTPPSECKTEWDAFVEKLKETGTILYTGSVMDSNYDGSYTNSEMESVINAACDDFVAVGEDIIEIARTFYDKMDGNTGNTQGSAPADTSTTSPTSSQTKKCEECGKTATKSVNLFGQTEYYCTTHYNEIMDIIDMMESNVGKGTASKHTCEECSSEGTHSIVGFSGQTEYYCTKHYNELQAMLEIFG